MAVPACASTATSWTHCCCWSVAAIRVGTPAHPCGADNTPHTVVQPGRLQSFASGRTRLPPFVAALLQLISQQANASSKHFTTSQRNWPVALWCAFGQLGGGRAGPCSPVTPSADDRRILCLFPVDSAVHCNLLRPHVRRQCPDSLPLLFNWLVLLPQLQRESGRSHRQPLAAAAHRHSACQRENLGHGKRAEHLRRIMASDARGIP